MDSEQSELIKVLKKLLRYGAAVPTAKLHRKPNRAHKTCNERQLNFDQPQCQCNACHTYARSSIGASILVRVEGGGISYFHTQTLVAEEEGLRLRKHPKQDRKTNSTSLLPFIIHSHTFENSLEFGEAQENDISQVYIAFQVHMLELHSITRHR